MGCASSSAAAGGVGGAENDRLDMQLMQDRLKELFKFKVLLLGAGESGKSTVVKQLRMIHDKRPSPQELVTIGDALHQNVVDCMKALIGACETYGYEIKDAEAKQTAATLEGIRDGGRLSPDLGQAVIRLYNCPAVKQAYERRNEFWLLDSIGYYIENLERFCEDDFSPNEEDAVMARIRTTGIVTTMLEQKRLNVKKDEPSSLFFEVVDVGGQQNERKKWIHCFDDVKAILFVVNLAGYNQVLFEDASKNRMLESLEVFRDVSRNQIFKETPIFLWLNKKDLFEKEIKKKGIKDVFPEYDGEDNDMLGSLEFIKNKFKELMPAGKQLEEIEVVTGVWKKEIKNAFDDAKRLLAQRNEKMIQKEKAELQKRLKN